MLRGNIAAPLLKILWKNLNSVKCYDKSNMNVFTLSQWENFRWGLIYFDQFIIINPSTSPPPSFHYFPEKNSETYITSLFQFISKLKPFPFNTFPAEYFYLLQSSSVYLQHSSYWHVFSSRVETVDPDQLASTVFFKNKK